MNPIFLSDTIVSALGWTLLHSLWQGAIFALLVLCILPKIKTAKSRYVFSYGALLSLFLASIYTFFRVYSPEIYTLEEGLIHVVNLFDNSEVRANNPHPSNSLTLASQQLSLWVEQNSSILLFLWTTGFLFFVFRTVGGLWYLGVMRTVGIKPIPEEWVQRFEDLKTKANIKSPIQIAQSEKVNTPLTMGYFKPIILFPIGLISQLSTEQVEAALAHELAHILRQDFALNLVQTFIETVFYYHPAVWFLGKKIREEREHCCDDFAMQLCKNPLTYAKTLVEIESIQQVNYTPQLAMALSGSNDKNQKSKLLNRIQRILNQPQQKNTQIMEKSIATLVLLFCLAAWNIKAKPAENLLSTLEDIAEKTVSVFEKSEPEFIPTLEISALKDTIEPKVIERRIEKYKKQDDDNEIEITMENGKIIELIDNGIVIPESRYGEYEETISYFKERSTAGEGKRVEKRITIINSDEDIEWTEDAEGQGIRKEIRIITNEEGDVISEEVHGINSGNEGENQIIVINSDEDGVENRVQVTSNTDEDGNSVVVINNGDERTEIQVIDGKVFMNGKEMNTGESVDVPGGEKRQHMIFIDEDEDEHVIEINENGEEQVIIINGEEGDWEERLEEISEKLGDRGAEMKIRVQEAMEKAELKAAEGARRIEVRVREMEEDVEERIQRRKERIEWEEQAKQEGIHLNDGSLAVEFRKKMIADDIISEKDNFKVILTAKKLVINRKKQSAERHKQYLDLYEDLKGRKLQGKDKVKINHETN